MVLRGSASSTATCLGCLNPASLPDSAARIAAGSGAATEADKIALSKQLTDLKVTVNPKYGAYDPTQAAVGPNTPDWLKFSAAADS